MEQRTPLSQGVSVQQFVIDRVIGYGASCLVYEAHYLDSGNHRKEIILKECYPYNSGTTRIGSKIVWSSTEEQEKAFRRFDNAYEIAAKIQNEAGAQSVSVYSLDKFTENGTQYVATIPVGKSYDKTKSDDLADIIRTALALTNAVGLYHKAGYLHLDIKPSNFIATEDQTGKGKNIVLFDVDTVVAQDDIQSGKPYTSSDLNYMNPFARCNREHITKKQVPVSGAVENFAEYDTVLIGFPIWYGCAPNVVNTFCKEYDFTGKKVAAFATSGGSGIGKTAEKLKPHVSGADVIDAKLINGVDKDTLKRWVDGL